MKITVTNTPTTLNDLIGYEIFRTSVLMQNTSVNDIFINNTDNDVLNEGVKLTAGNESVYDVKYGDKLFLQASGDSDIKILFS